MPARPFPLHRAALWTAHLATAATVAWFAVAGLDYYLAPLAERPRHEQFWELKPGGDLGLRFGTAGATMMTLLLIYSVRKRVPALRRLGSLRKWLDWHIFLGIHGPLLIVLHSSLKVGGLVSISFWSMLAVAASGVLGRFLYLQIPRTVAGEEIRGDRLIAEDAALTRVLAAQPGLDEDRLAAVLRLAEHGTTRTGGLLALLLRLPFEVVALRVRLAVLLRGWRDLDRGSRRRTARAALAAARTHRRMLLLDSTRRLFRYWHVIHKPFALVLYVLMVVHVSVAWMTGYGSLGP